MPSEVIAEWESAPEGTLETILEFRAFARAKRNYEQAQHLESGPEKNRVMADPLVQMARAFDFEEAEARIGRADTTDGGRAPD